MLILCFSFCLYCGLLWGRGRSLKNQQKWCSIRKQRKVCGKFCKKVQESPHYLKMLQVALSVFWRQGWGQQNRRRKWNTALLPEFELLHCRDWLYYTVLPQEYLMSEVRGRLCMLNRNVFMGGGGAVIGYFRAQFWH
jgi:hypothetical protein